VVVILRRSRQSVFWKQTRVISKLMRTAVLGTNIQRQSLRKPRDGILKGEASTSDERSDTALILLPHSRSRTLLNDVSGDHGAKAGSKSR
jgi:hypothetical protein